MNNCKSQSQYSFEYLQEWMAWAAEYYKVADSVLFVVKRVALNNILFADGARVAPREERSERRDELEVQVEIYTAKFVEYEVPCDVRLLKRTCVGWELLVYWIRM